MALSPSLRRALGDNSLYTRGMADTKSSVQTQIDNATMRLNAAGVSSEAKKNQNFLIKALDIIARPGYGATNLIREFTNSDAGGTPGQFDPLGAFWRGIKGDERSSGKDVFEDLGLPGDTGIFGGENHWYNPSAAGALGLVLDIFNPLDPLNWLGFGVGDDIVKGASKGLNALTDAFGATKAAQIADILTTSAKTADSVGDIAKGAKAVDTASDVAKAANVLDDLGADTVGNLIKQLTGKVDDVGLSRQLGELVEAGMKETGKVATSALDYKVMRPLSVGLQNPLSITPIGGVKLPGYTARGGRGKIPIVAPGRDIAGTFVSIPGSEYVTNVVGSIAKKIGNTSVGQALGKMFSTVFVPANVPSSVVKKNMTASNMDDLVNLSRTTPTDVPLSADELLSLQDELANIELGKTFDFADDFSATDLRILNKGTYFSVEELAKKTGLKGFTTDEVVELLNNKPFTKSITELYDDLRVLKPTVDAKELFTDAAKVRKVMDLMYEQIPEGAKPYFTGVLKSQVSDLYPSDITTSRLGANIAKSPLMAYEFDYKGVPISVVVNSGENFNVESWAKLSSAFEALDELPETAIQALKGQIDISPIPIKSPDTSMTVGDTIVLGRIDKPTVAHEFGHIWDAAAGDQNAYTQAILSDAQRFDNTITPDDLYSDYSRSIYASDADTGLKEDFADSVSDYLRDRSSFRSQYPGRAAEIERVLDQVSIPQEELARMIADQRKLADQVSNIPRTEAQIKTMLDSVDQYAFKFSSESGEKAYQTFRQNLSSLYEQTNWKTRQWQQQVDELFRGIDKEGRKQIMDAAAQITGTEVPGRAKSMAQPMFAQQDFPVFMSKLEESVNKMPNRMPVEDFKNYLRGKQVKKEELKWTFIDDLLEGKTHVTKAEVQQWVAGNKLDVEEIWYGRPIGTETPKTEAGLAQHLIDEFPGLSGVNHLDGGLYEVSPAENISRIYFEQLEEGPFNKDKFVKRLIRDGLADEQAEIEWILKGIDNFEGATQNSFVNNPASRNEISAVVDNLMNQMDDVLMGTDFEDEMIEIASENEFNQKISSYKQMMYDNLDLGEVRTYLSEEQVDEVIDTYVSRYGDDENMAVEELMAEWGIDINNPATSDVNPSKYNSYTQPGGENYTELVFVLPEDYARPRGGVTGDINPLKMEYEDLASRIDDIREELGRESQEFITMNRRLQELEAQGIATTPMESPQYRSSHWEEPNVVAHTRFDTRYTEDGKKVLFIDEVQSDWHQTGRDKGYREVGKHDLAREERDKLALLRSTYLDDQAHPELSFQERIRKAEEISQQIQELERKFDNSVPDAPFRNNWDEYVQKRLLRYAADNGYDGIAWSTGVQQAERWQQAVTEAIDTIQYNQTGHNLRAYKNGEEVFSQLVEPNKLAEMVGADNARKLLNTEPDTFSVRPVARNPSTELSLSRMPENLDPIEMTRWMDQQPEFQALRPVDGSQGAPQGFQVVDQNGNAWGYTYPSAEAAQKAIDDLATVEQRVKTVSGTNVTIGGEGMRKFYDQQIPSNFKKLGKQFGLEVGNIDLTFGDVSRSTSVFDYYEGFFDLEEVFYGEFDEAGRITNHDVTKKIIDLVENPDHTITEMTHNDLDRIIERYIQAAKNVAEEDGLITRLDAEAIKHELSIDLDDILVGNTTIKNTQQGIWLNPGARTKITQQSFPLFADNTKAPVDDLTAGWSEKQINALDNFLKWRNSVVKQYQQIGIPINELEKYVPFIPQRPLRTDEAEVLKTVFGTGVKDATADNFDTLLTELSKADPNLKTRTTQARRPAEVNKLLKKPWLTEDAAVAMNIRGRRAIKAQELSNFVDEFVESYGLRANHLVQDFSGTIPEGYAAFRIGKDQTGNKVLQQASNIAKDAIEGTDIVFLPQEMANLYNEYYGTMFSPSKRNGLLQVYDSLSNLYKKSAYLWNPGHIMRDFQGNVFNNYLMGVTDPTEYADGLKALRKAEGVLQTPRGELPFSEIYEQAQKLGIVDSVMSHEIPLQPTRKAEGAYSTLMRKATYATDGWTRMTGFIHNLKAGQDYAQAAVTTKKFLFDYFDLTAFEKKAMKRIIPFYTWMRKNIPLQLKSLVTDPRIFARLSDIQNAIAGGPIDWSEKPNYIQDTMAIQPLGSNKYVSNTLPWQDLTKIPTGISSDALGDLLSSVNPLIRAPIESITNQNWWTGRALEDYSGEQTDIPILTTLLNLLGSDTNLQVGARYGGNLLNQIPILTRAGGLLDAATGQETNDSRILSRVSTTLGGPSLYDASSVQNSADWQERQRLVDLIRLLQDQGVEVPTVNELESPSRYQRLKKALGGR